MNINIKVKDWKTGQIYEPGEVFHVVGVILKKSGEIYRIRVFNNNAGVIQTRPVEDFMILQLN